MGRFGPSTSWSVSPKTLKSLYDTMTLELHCSVRNNTGVVRLSARTRLGPDRFLKPTLAWRLKCHSTHKGVINKTAFCQIKLILCAVCYDLRFLMSKIIEEGRGGVLLYKVSFEFKHLHICASYFLDAELVTIRFCGSKQLCQDSSLIAFIFSGSSLPRSVSEPSTFKSGIK